MFSFPDPKQQQKINNPLFPDLIQLPDFGPIMAPVYSRIIVF